MADAVIKGKAALLAKFPRITPEVEAAIAPIMEDEVEHMRSAISRAAPVLHRPSKERTPGQLAASIQKYPNPSRPLSWRIIAGARDAASRLWARYVEFGHGEAGPMPFFFPTYRANKKRLRTRAYAAARKVLSAMFGS